MRHFQGLATSQLPVGGMELLERWLGLSGLPVLSRGRPHWAAAFSALPSRSTSGGLVWGSCCKGQELLPAVRPHRVAEVSAWEPGASQSLAHEAREAFSSKPPALTSASQAPRVPAAGQ